MKKLHQGGCHCGAVRFECQLDPADSTSRCNCSMCAKGRFWKAIARKEDFRILQGESELSDYQFGSKNIHHLFCRQCGIKPFGRGHMEALGGTFYAVNVACLDDVEPADLVAAPVIHVDGRHDDFKNPPKETRHL